MATETRHSGTLRTDYESDLAHADALPVMESERQRLMHREYCHISKIFKLWRSFFCSA